MYGWNDNVGDAVTNHPERASTEPVALIVTRFLPVVEDVKDLGSCDIVESLRT
jgi:hypothetical protein